MALDRSMCGLALVWRKGYRGAQAFRMADRSGVGIRFADLDQTTRRLLPRQYVRELNRESLMANKSVLLKIKRQNTPTSKSYWEEFELAYHSGMNVISSLMEIAANPVTREGKPTTP